MTQGINSPISQKLVKLPPVKLPTFNGQYSTWLEFKDTFVALVDSDTSLTDIQKFYYLRSSLEKEVLKIIESLDMSNNNYKEAWKFLVERFENKKIIIYNHIKAIFEHPSLTKESYSDLRNLYDSITKHLRCLKNLGENIESWDRLIIYIMSNKFDFTTRRDWESFKIKNELPTMEDLNKFLKQKCEVLEKLDSSEFQKQNSGKMIKFNKKQAHSFTSTSSGSLSEGSKFICYYCKGEHSIYNCVEFLKLKVEDRISSIKGLKLCLNCLRDSHPSWKCQRAKCSKCRRPHNKLLHLETFVTRSNLNTTDGANNTIKDDASVSSSNENREIASTDNKLALNAQVVESGVVTPEVVSQVLLSTALVKLYYKNKCVTVRALLDSGSQSNFLSRRVCDKLDLTETKVEFVVKGINKILTNINSQVNITLNSRVTDFKIDINCLVLDKITDQIPLMSFDKNILNIPIEVNLADPNFNKSDEIDILLGSNVFWLALKTGRLELGKNLPILQETEFGFIIAGNLSSTSVNCNLSLGLHCINEVSSVDEKIEKFWQLEDVSKSEIIMSESEKYCEKYFEETTERNELGKYVVKIPFRNNVHKLGKSRDMAFKRFKLLEGKLNKNLELKQEYCAFMSEYLSMGHMTPVTDYKDDGFFLPHHAVIKNESLTTKCRVVFDASAKSSTGLSLNEVQFVGPTLQQDIFSILVRFRTYEYVLTGDISKMYRQILLAESDTNYQKIFWRENSEEELKLYKLNTVTYGCASSPYLAVKCLFHLAEKNAKNYPCTSRIIKRDFYMDDLLTGANSINELVKIQNDVVSVLGSAGFELRKFLSNNKEVMNKFKLNEHLNNSILDIGENEQNKTLGIYWDSNNDFIKYKISTEDKLTHHNITKRTMLSLVCQIFDPLGLVSPVVIVAKLLIQDLWKLNLSWDENIPLELFNNFISFYKDLSVIRLFNIPRHASFSKYIKIEMHGFSDASIKAYGACVYLRCSIDSSNFVSNLLCAKSRVAPIKTVSLPRLELCGAVLLSNLVDKVKGVINLTIHDFYYWSDSTISLYWIKNEPNRWKTFVANRVSEIRSLTNYRCWNHVKSEDNPADLISRGSLAEDLLINELWWYGPKWFKYNNVEWKHLQIKVELTEIPEQRTIQNIVAYVVIENNKEFNHLISRISSFQKIIRVLAYALRYLAILKAKINKSQENLEGPLRVSELQYSLFWIIKRVQMESFPREYDALINKKMLPKNSKILNLNPFMHEGVLRVGGRIKNSDLEYDRKHPVILPHNHIITTLILREEHVKLLHCGVQNLLSVVRERFWPISGRSACKKIVNSCIKCYKMRPKNCNYLMGDLPEARVKQNSVFLNVGTDFGGPFNLKDRQTRNPKLIKGYVCLFICMTTKAVHLELVSELTTAAFLATLNRFIGRRGKPANIYSDNGSNYVGANNELNKMHEFLSNNADYIANHLVVDKINWHFIPAYSPTFGGLWEAGIKSVKHHLKRVIGDRALTFEQFNTVLVQIECILNSRPISPITDDPEDLTALTPGHFIIGRPLTSSPDYNLIDVAENRLNKWQSLQAMVQHYWSRWHKEYLAELQTRSKWKVNCKELLKIGSLVLLKADNVPPMCWQLGRVVGLRPGKDGIIRVVEVKVQSGVVSRAVNRLCALPIEQ